MRLPESAERYLVQRTDKLGDGAYWIPHDEEALRLDLIAQVSPTNGVNRYLELSLTCNKVYSHHLFLLTFNDKLHLAPLQNPKRVIDIGTGIGIWAS